jgi:hypothetical protein
VRDASRAEQEHPQTARMELRGRSEEMERSMRQLVGLVGEAVESDNRLAALAVADCVIDVTGDIPTEEAKDVAWSALGEVLQLIIRQSGRSSANAFTTRAALLIKRTAEALGASDGVNRKFDRAARVLRDFRTYASPADFASLVSVADAMVGKAAAGALTSEQLVQSGEFISEILLGRISATDPQEKLDQVASLLKPAPSDDGAKFVVRRTVSVMVDEATVGAVAQAEAGDLVGAMATYRSLSTVIGRLNYEPELADRLRRSLELGRVVSSICAAKDSDGALSDLGVVRTIASSYDVDAELAIARALVARGFLREARERLAKLSIAIDHLTDASEAKANVARLMGVSLLLEGNTDEAAVHFSEAWDIRPGLARLEQISFAHVLLSIGKPAFAAGLVRRLGQGRIAAPVPSLSLKPDEDTAELAFLGARVRLAQGDAKGALDLIGESRRARGSPLLLPLLDEGSDDRRSQRQDVLAALGGYWVLDTRSWRGSPDLPSNRIAADAPPSRPLETALAAAIALQAGAGTLTEDQWRVVTDELRAATRSPTSVAFARANAFASISHDSARDHLHRLILNERPRRYRGPQETDQPYEFYGEWPPSSYRLEGYLSAHAPCEAAAEHRLPARQRSIEALAKKRAPSINPLDSNIERDEIAALTKEFKPEALANPELFNVPTLRDHEAAIVITGSGRTVYTTVIRKGAMSVHRASFVSPGLDVDTLVREARREIEAKRGEPLQGDSQLSTLSRLALWPALRDLDGISSLIVVSRGPLSGLPTHLFKLPGLSGKDEEWLDTRFASRVLPGLDSLYPSVFLNDDKAAVTDVQPKFFAVADPANLGPESGCTPGTLLTPDGFIDPTRFTSICSAPYTRKIADGLNGQVGDKNSPENNWMRAGEDADEPDVIGDSRLASAKIVLFATHGLVACSEWRAWRSPRWC